MMWLELHCLGKARFSRGCKTVGYLDRIVSIQFSGVLSARTNLLARPVEGIKKENKKTKKMVQRESIDEEGGYLL